MKKIFLLLLVIGFVSLAGLTANRPRAGAGSGTGYVSGDDPTFGDVTITGTLDVTGASGLVGDVEITGDLTVTGDDITATTNTIGAVWVGDGTNFNPVVLGTDATVAANGAVTVVDDSHNHVIGNIDAFSSSDFAGQISDETGSGLAVFGTSPTLIDNIYLSGEGTALYLDYGSAGAEDHDVSIYFGDDASNTAHSLKWDDGESKFLLSDNLLLGSNKIYSAGAI